MLSEPDILLLGQELGRLILVTDDHLKCSMCLREFKDIVAEEHGSTLAGACPVGDIMRSYRELLAKSQGAPPPLVLPDKMPAQGVYTNMVTLLTLSHVLTHSVPESPEGKALNETITGTLIGLCKQLKRHIPGRSVIDQVLELLPDSATPSHGA